ncbi:HEAT repeat domain-containing protein [Dyadobacter arcticus]|uniref:VIT1/CCC1 family predicted Fe2+/Mn2+ transporter n=1 Tax=Dyadobacter arcticus TaxID=1078754 RepID=A0ABX0ULS6_9BACT|nr:HEAT repeat domain-containing protein [Dyadobacter arcticus]NIJ53948.1 VIT1/CCC1 family predicted Fe2+/Mn2+ transporter [Dyadobacter arcticus]
MLNIRKDEEGLVALLMSYSFFMGGATALFYTVVASSFLVSFDRLIVPQVYVVGGIFIYLVGIGVTRLQKKLPFDKLAENMLIFLIVSIAAFLLTYHFTGSRWVFFVLFIWNRVFVLVNGVTFWAVVVKLFNFQQSKRLSSLINTGDVFSSVIMYLAVPALLKIFPIDFLLIIAVAFLIVCAFLLRQIHKKYVTAEHSVNEAGRTSSEQAPENAVNRTYYRNIFLLALLPVFALFYVEYIFFTESRNIFPNKESLASFLGVFFGICAILEFFIKTFLYNKLISKYGLRIGLLALPISLVFSFAVSVIYGLGYDTAAIFFACVALSRFFMSAIRKAISEPAYQVLYQPIQARFRLNIQGRIEGRAKAMGGLTAGLLLFVLVNLAHLEALPLSILFLIVAVGWALVAFMGQNSYKKMVREKVFRFPAKPSKTDLYAPHYQPGEKTFDELVNQIFSQNEAERIEATIGLGASNRFSSYKYLIPLLQDSSIEVRSAAIYTAGELRRPELWPYLMEQLDADRYYSITFEALSKSGIPLLKYIEKSFISNSENRYRQLHLLKIVQNIGGEEAVRFLRRNLEHPNRFVKDKVVAALKNLSYCCNSTERIYLLNELDEHLRTFAWLLAVQYDVTDDYGPETQLILNLEREKERIILKAFAVLEVVYGSRFRVVRLLKGDQATDARDYLTEIADLLLPENVKNKILPYLDSDSLDEMRNRYSEIFAQTELSVEERLTDIINKDYTRISRWTKAVAIRELRHFPSENVTAVLVSNAVSRSKVISQTAFYILRIVNPARFRALFEVMSRNGDQFHLQIMKPLEWLATEEDLLICKLRRLRETTALSQLLNGELQKIQLNSAYFQDEEGEVIDLRKHTNAPDLSILITYGKLFFSKAGVIGAGELRTIEELKETGAAMIPNVLENTEFYIIENYLLRDLNITQNGTESAEVR